MNYLEILATIYVVVSVPSCISVLVSNLILIGRNDQRKDDKEQIEILMSNAVTYRDMINDLRIQKEQLLSLLAKKETK